MGNGLFSVDGVDIAGLVAEHIGPRVLDATLTIFDQGARDPAKLTGGKARTPRPPQKCKGFWRSYSTRAIDGQIILTGDRRAVLIGDTNAAAIAALKPRDLIAMEGVTYAIVRLEKRDPAAATWTFQCRDPAKMPTEG